MWVEPGWLVNYLMYSALPAFVCGMAIVSVLWRLGINEIWSFLISMPILIFAWFYFVSWLVDRWIFQRRRQT